MANDQRLQNHLGSLLVGLQFGLILALAWLAWPAVLAGQVPLAAWGCLIFGMAVGLWAVSVNRLGNFNIRPAPRLGGALIEQGPYRWIRHPMYSAVILCGLACTLASASGLGWLLLAALAVVLTVKAGVEERWMLSAHPAYAAYSQRTRRFIPWLL